MGLPDSKENQVGTVTWREQAIYISAGQVLIADMPPAMLESFRFWLSNIRYSPKLGMSRSDAYFLDDIEDFLVWEQAQANLDNEN